MANRYMRKGTTRFYFVPTIASATLVPTVSEITAGTRLDAQISAVNGFEFQNNPIQTPDMASTFTSQIPGEDSAADSNIEFYELTNGTDTIHDLLDKGLVGYIVIFFKGTTGASPAIADKVDTWPAIIASNSRMYTADNEAAKYRVNFSLTAPPGFDLAIAA